MSATDGSPASRDLAKRRRVELLVKGYADLEYHDLDRLDAEFALRYSRKAEHTTTDLHHIASSTRTRQAHKGVRQGR